MRTFLIILSLVLIVSSSALAAKPDPDGVDGRKQAGTSARPCTAAQLSVRSDPNFNDSAMGGQRGASYIVKNHSKSPCTIKGRPGIVLIDGRGRMMGKPIAPTKGGNTTIAGGKEAAFEVGYHSCGYANSAAGHPKRKCRTSKTAQIRFWSISKTFIVADKLDAAPGIEQVEDWLN